MKKTYALLVAGLIGTASFSTPGFAQLGAPEVPTAGNQDVAQLAYQLRLQLYKQQGVIEARHADVMEAHKDYTDDPSVGNFQALAKALQKDTDAVTQYTQLLGGPQTQSLEKKIETAEQKYYEETPATKSDITSGPTGKDAPKGGESVESELPLLEQPGTVPPPPLVDQLKKEIRENPGGIGKQSFAEQLQKQMTQLQSVKQRVEEELKNDPAVASNPTAKQQTTSLQSILEKAILARRQAFQDLGLAPASKGQSPQSIPLNKTVK